MNCEEVRTLIQDELDGLLGAERSVALRGHLSSCPSCRSEFEVLRTIDLALAGRPLDRAPRWLPDAVLADIGRKAASRRLVERVAISVGVPAGLGSLAVGVRTIVARSGAGEAVSGAASRLAESVREATVSLIGTPGLSTAWSGSPGAQGFVWALAAVALSFLAITALRLSRKHHLEWN